MNEYERKSAWTSPAASEVPGLEGVTANDVREALRDFDYSRSTSQRAREIEYRATTHGEGLRKQVD